MALRIIRHYVLYGPLGRVLKGHPHGRSGPGRRAPAALAGHRLARRGRALGRGAAGCRGCLQVLSLLYGSSYHSNVVIPFKPNREAGKAGLLVFEAEYMKSLEAVHR